MLSEFHFLRPYWFIALIPLVGLLWMLAKRHLINEHWESICDPALLPYILVGKTGTKRYKNISLLGLVTLLSVIALAGPSWERLPQPVFQKQSALVIVLDLSYSMYADDIKPSRLERAQFKISDLLDLRKEGQTALLVYAGDAFTVTPLTDDIKTIKLQLTALSPEIMPARGSNTGIAITKAVELLKQAGNSQGHILLVTDEVDVRYEKQIAKADAQEYPVSILAIGTDAGAPVKTADGSFLKDRAGTIVIPKLDQNSLRSLVNAGSGRYQLSQINDRDIERLNQLFNEGLETNEETRTEFDTDQWQEFGPWLILLIIPIAAFCFRRGYLSILLGIMIINPEPAMAFEWNDLWLNKNQKAMHSLDNEQAEFAAELFQDDEWKAAAKYRAGDYPAVEALLEQQSDSRSIYNRANAIAKQGRYEEAIAAYDEVLKSNPENEDAKFNKELIEKELEKKQNQQQSQSDQDSEDQDSQEQQENSDKEQQSASQQAMNELDDEVLKSNPENEDAKFNKELIEKELEKKQNQQQSQSDQDSEDQDSQEQQENSDKEQQSASQQAMNELDEEQQASEQWLRRIPDDPAGLLRRKFKYQYQQQNRQPTNEKYW